MAMVKAMGKKKQKGGRSSRELPSLGGGTLKAGSATNQIERLALAHCSGSSLRNPRNQPCFINNLPGVRGGL